MKYINLAIIVCLLGAMPAMASMYGTVDVSYQSVSGLKIAYQSGGVTTSNICAGLMTIDLSNVSLYASTDSSWSGGLSGVVEAFCVDLQDNAKSVTVEYDVVDLAETPDPASSNMGSLKAAYVAELLDEYWNDSYLTSKLNKAALQLAIWEIVDEDGSDFDITSGTFSLVSVKDADLRDLLIDEVTSLLSSLSTGTDPYDKYVGLTNDDDTKLYQDFVVKVPVPGAVLLGVIGIGAAGARLRRRRDVRA